ncbi:MAG TPA: NAD(P)/FAD-dependent oxidoreductase [Mycobacteriales bacterium]|jgi:cation diffusion facilitator CzcD-associated flavoprotein CzcO|nr:NAD(P)/FAD-dependent oxidoreductase [Mycobacteriales bacterium]
MVDSAVEHVDVLVIGAGLSGVGAGCHLTMSCPGKSFAILESRETIGGTWDLFRYPGIRSDSDMYTLGYPFRPWKEAKAIADGPSILRYVRETAAEFGVDKKVRFRHKVVAASWSSDDLRWTVDIERTDTGERLQMTADFVLTCTGYYRYDEGYTPEFKGTESFRGQIIHPQHWPEDLDYTGKRVVIIGSGATAVTLVPSMAPTAAHVTMLQRSPSYVLSLPEQDPLAKLLRKFLSPTAAFPIIRWKNVLTATLFYQLSKRRPALVKKLLRKGLEAALPSGYAIDTHFKPKYDPWDQRLCFVPDGDLFKALSSGSASIETDTIDTFTETGLRLASGKELDADIIVTATGLNMLAVGGMKFTVDGRPVKLSETVGYKGMMFSGIPNLATAVGYTNASWTLKCDLTCEYVCRLLNYMDDEGYQQVVPTRPDPSEPTLPFIDLKSGYVQRSIDDFPRQGTRAPWRLYQNYIRDVLLLRHGKLDDGALKFSKSGRRAQSRDEDRAPAA